MNSKKPVFRGSGVALITPFTNGKVNFEQLKKLIEFQISEGTDAIITLGTTGEPATMTETEKQEVLKFTLKTVNKRIPVIAGAGGNNTLKAVETAKKTADFGADGILVITPYYNKCTQGGIIKHFFAIADSISLPITVYNVPSRTGVNILPSTLKELCKHNNINSIKEACGNFEQICETLKVCSEEGMIFYSGDDAFTYPTMAMGGSGVISVAANIVPRFMKGLTQSFFEGNLQESGKMHMQLFPLVRALFCEVNPIPVKAAAEIMNICSGELRLPLTEIEPQNRQKLLEALKNFGINI